MPTLIYCDVDGIDRQFALGKEPVLVGRAAECTIRSDDARMSRMHARFVMEEGTLWVEDLGSANGVYVGYDKVRRSQVPLGEIVVVGSIVFQAAGPNLTLPPPYGVHATLAQWLSLERKGRRAIEDERNAFAKRVGDLHAQIAAADGGNTEALRSELADLDAALRVADSARMTAERETQSVRETLASARQHQAAQLDALRTELAAEKNARALVEAQRAVENATAVAEAEQRDRLLAQQRNEATAAARAEAVAAAGQINDKLAHLGAQLADVEQQVNKAEKESAAAQIRAQGAERNLAQARAQAAAAARVKADLATRATVAEQRAAELAERVEALTLELSTVNSHAAIAQREQVVSDLRAAETALSQAAARHAAELADALAAANAQSEAQFAERLAERQRELDALLGARVQELRDAAAAREREFAEQLALARDGGDTRTVRVSIPTASSATMEFAATTDSEVAAASAAHDEFERLSQQAAEATNALIALRLQSDARATSYTAEIATLMARIADGERVLGTTAMRATQAEATALELQRAVSNADTMAKALANDVTASMRRAVDAENRASAVAREHADAISRFTAGEARIEQLERGLSEAQGALADVVTANDALKTDYAAATVRLAAIEPQLRDATQQLLVTRKSLDDAEARLDAARRRLDDDADAVGQANAWRAQLDGALIALTDAERRLADSQAMARADAQHRADVALMAPTTAPTPSADAAAQFATLEESIDSLRANIRAARDEAAAMPASSSVEVVTSAIDQADDEMQRARQAVRALLRWAGLGEP